MSGVQGIWRRLVEITRETQWLLPLLGAIVGVLLALALGRVEASPDEVNWTLTISEGRGTLLSWLSILFAAFSIILALATLTIQNVISKYSVRMYRLYQRDLRDRYVLALFAMTASYIVTEQILLRSADPADPVPATGFIVAFVLLVATGIAMIWYITTITRWFRVDNVARRIARRVLVAAEVRESLRHGTVRAADAAFDRPHDAVPIRARGTGYVVEPDPHDVVTAVSQPGVTAVIARVQGAPVVEGEEIGWMVPGPAGASTPEDSAVRVGRTIECETERGVAGSIGYGIVVLVDTAIMALSPAVNDPNTAVQIIEEMTYLFVGLAQRDLGSFAMESGTGSAVIRSPSFGEYLHLGTEQIVLYGKDDPLVVDSLNRMVTSLASIDLSTEDRAAVDDFIGRVSVLARP